jgi:predicted nucleotidyltransferase
MHPETGQEISAAHSRVHWTASGILALGVRRIGLFASSARGALTADSDMDLLVVGFAGMG